MIMFVRENLRFWVAGLFFAAAAALALKRYFSPEAREQPVARSTQRMLGSRP
jgi:hypothetical protein